MRTLSPIEQEVNQIRLDIYEKTKDMTPAQLTEYYRKSGEISAPKYGFKVVSSAKITVVFYLCFAYNDAVIKELSVVTSGVSPPQARIVYSRRFAAASANCISSVFRRRKREL